LIKIFSLFFSYPRLHGGGTLVYSKLVDNSWEAQGANNLGAGYSLTSQALHSAKN